MAKWKPKERNLTPEEAIAQATEALKPFWYKSDPLIAATVNASGAHVFPLDPSFREKSLLIFLVDPTSVLRKEALVYAREYYKRYAQSDVNFLMILKGSYSYLKDRAPVELFMHRNGIAFPLAIDQDGALFAAFGVNAQPKVLFMDKGAIVIERSGPNWTDGFELELQKNLRSKEPGLALLNPYSPAFDRMEDTIAVEFGTAKLKDTFPPPGCRVTGKWVREADRIVTEDPKATICLPAHDPDVSIVVQPISEMRMTVKIMVEFENSPMDAGLLGSDAQTDETAGVVMVDIPRMYHALKGVPKGAPLKFSFSDARKCKIAVYGIRFGASIGGDAPKVDNTPQEEPQFFRG